MRLLPVGVGALFAVALLATPADAAQLNGGCAGSAVSFDSDGVVLDEVIAPGDGGTSKRPFDVDPDGTVEYEGSTPVAFHDHSWHVDVMGITVKDGGSANSDDLQATDGVVEVSDYLPIDAVGLYKVSGGIDAAEGSCDGSLWVKVAGSPVGTLPWIVGVGATAGGVAALAGPALASALAGMRGGR